MSDDEAERMRVEAAKRLERRKKKIQQQSEARLAKITGQPVPLNEPVEGGSASPMGADLQPPRVVEETETNLIDCEIASNGFLRLGNGDPQVETTTTAEDPPLEQLTRLNLASNGPTMNQTVVNKPQLPDCAWFFFGIATYLALQTSVNSALLSSSILPFMILFISLYLFGHVCAAPTTSSSLISAALQLGGLTPGRTKIVVAVKEILFKGKHQSKFYERWHAFNTSHNLEILCTTLKRGSLCLMAHLMGLILTHELYMRVIVGENETKTVTTST